MSKIVSNAYSWFQINDKILILHQVNNDWYFGQNGENQGMFPANFIKVIVPLNDTNPKNNQRSPDRMVKATFSFSAETWDDLEFQVSILFYNFLYIKNQLFFYL